MASGFLAVTGVRAMPVYELCKGSVLQLPFQQNGSSEFPSTPVLCGHPHWIYPMEAPWAASFSASIFFSLTLLLTFPDYRHGAKSGGGDSHFGRLHQEGPGLQAPPLYRTSGCAIPQLAQDAVSELAQASSTNQAWLNSANHHFLL